MSGPIQSLPPEIYVSFAGPINIESTMKIIAAFSDAVKLGVENVHFLIQSYGGTTSDGIAIYNFLSNLPLNIVCYNAGAIESAAVLVFLAGRVRKCADTARFLIHKCTQQNGPNATAQTMREKLYCAESDDKRVEVILERYLTMPNDKWDVYRSRDLLISSEESINYNISHSIGHFTPPRRASLFCI